MRLLVIQAKLQEEPSDTPLQEKLDAMAALIGYIGMACAAATFVATMCVYFTTHRVSDGVTIALVDYGEQVPLPRVRLPHWFKQEKGC